MRQGAVRIRRKKKVTSKVYCLDHPRKLFISMRTIQKAFA